MIKTRRQGNQTHNCNDLLASSPSFSISTLVLRGLIALASFGGKTSLRISISGWSRGTILVLLDLRASSRGRGASVTLWSESVSSASDESEEISFDPVTEETVMLLGGCTARWVEVVEGEGDDMTGDSTEMDLAELKRVADQAACFDAPENKQPTQVTSSCVSYCINKSLQNGMWYLFKSGHVEIDIPAL